VTSFKKKKAGTDPYSETDNSRQHTVPLIFFLILSSHLCLGHRCGFFLSGFRLKFCMHFWSLPCAACPTFINIRDLFTLIIFFEENKLCSSTWLNTYKIVHITFWDMFTCHHTKRHLSACSSLFLLNIENITCHSIKHHSCYNLCVLHVAVSSFVQQCIKSYFLKNL